MGKQYYLTNCHKYEKYNSDNQCRPSGKHWKIPLADYLVVGECNVVTKPESVCPKPKLTCELPKPYKDSCGNIIEPDPKEFCYKAKCNYY